MKDATLTAHLDFLLEERGEDEASVLAQALRTGIETLYRDALIEAYLLGRVTRERMLTEVGQDQLAEIEYQRDALRRDVAWGLQGA